MKKLIGILSLCVALSGCMAQTVNSNDIETGTKICAKHNSAVVEIEAWWSGGEYVRCSNRQRFNLDRND